MSNSSKLLEDAVEAFSSLPGLGRKTALRLALHLMDQPKERVVDFSNAIQDFRIKSQKCQACGHLSDVPMCSICTDIRRDNSVICVVESIRDVMAIEATQQFFGLYHVLGGVISPIDGVGPESLTIDVLTERIEKLETKELILAMRPSIEGDTTAYYLSKKVAPWNVKISMISRGISFGGELEYTDEITLGRSISGRLPYNPNVMLSS